MRGSSASPERAPEREREQDWWRHAVVYQIYPRSFASSKSGKGGVGDLRGIIHRLDHIASLGVDAIWLSPIFVSPQADHGYDVANYRAIDPLFGTMADFDDLLRAAHERGLKVTIDMVPNHTSDQHPWFREALAAGPGSPERERYLFRDGRGRDGEHPPTDVVSSFSGPAWTRVTEADGQPGQWVFHLFAPEQPDLNWHHPDVLAEFERVWRFWLDRGVDGFRVDVADHLSKDVDRNDRAFGNELLEHGPQVVSHVAWRALRRVLDAYDPPRMAVGEVWAGADDATLYCRPDEFNTIFNFPFLKAGWDATAVRDAINEALSRRGHVGVPPSWVLDNHDTPRSATRLAVDPRASLRRSRAMTLLMLGLPGLVYLYQGQELGLPNVDDLPDEVLVDPVWERSGHTDRGRDGCRVPFPWERDGSSLGFSVSGGAPWLPQPRGFGELAVAAQNDDPTSTLSRLREWLQLRRSHPAAGSGSAAWLPSESGVLHLERQYMGDRLELVCNMTDAAVPLPGGSILARSGDFDREVGLPPDTTIWTAPEIRPGSGTRRGSEGSSRG